LSANAEKTANAENSAASPAEGTVSIEAPAQE
jgi:hypothetical protein